MTLYNAFMASGARWGPHHPVRPYHAPPSINQSQRLKQRPRVVIQHTSRPSPRRSAALSPDSRPLPGRRPECPAVCRSRALLDNVHHRTLPRAPSWHDVRSSLRMAEQQRRALQTVLPVSWARYGQNAPILLHTKTRCQHHRCYLPRPRKTAKKTRIYAGRWTTRSRVRPNPNRNRIGRMS